MQYDETAEVTMQALEIEKEKLGEDNLSGRSYAARVRRVPARCKAVRRGGGVVEAGFENRKRKC